MQEPVQSQSVSQSVSQPTSAAGEAPVAPADAGSKAKEIPK